jgi:hypothetical protein
MSLAVAVATATAVVALPTAAQARFTATGSGALSVSADTLAPPTAVTFTKKCTVLGYGGNSVTVDWSASADAYANGYTVALSTGGSVAATATTTGHNATEATLSVPKLVTTYTITVVSSYQQWTSVTVSPGSVSCGYFGN